MAPWTTYHIVTRSDSSAAIFQRLPEASPPFGLNRSPPFQFMQRLKDFPPNLTDAIVVASTASTDIGLVTRSKTPLDSNFPAEKIVDVFTTTTMAEDSRRAQLPLTEELGETSPIGVALDLSSKDKVKRPLPQEEFEESPGPLPALMVLNNEGLLATWWIVYAESIRQGTIFPGLAIIGGMQLQQQPQAQRQVSPFTASSPPAPAFAQSAVGNPPTSMETFSNTASTPTAPTFVSSSTPGSAFGAPPGLGQQKSVWNSSSNGEMGAQTAAPAFGQQAFGSSNPMGNMTQGTAFGMAGGLGNKISPWGTSSSGAAVGSTGIFGQPSKLGSQTSPFANNSTSGVFGSNATPNNSPAPSGGFASFASKSSGFLSAIPSTSVAQSVFGKPSTGATFGSGIGTHANFGQQQNQDAAPKGLFGSGGGGFQLGSTFKADGTASNDASKLTNPGASSMFGSNFGSTLGDVASSQSKDADMNDEDEEPTTKSGNEQKDAEPSAPPPAQPKFQFPKTDPPKSGGLFGTQSQGKTTPAEVQNSQPAGFSFGKPTPITTTPNETPKKMGDRPASLIETSPKIKEEPDSDEDDISPLNDEEAQPPDGYGGTDSGASSRSKTPETPAGAKTSTSDAPLPPESTSKASYTPGDSSNSSKSSGEVALPPDSTPSNTKLKEIEAPSPERAKLPSDDDDDDDEGSGVDVGQEVSPSNSNQSSKITPESSFGLVPGKSSPDSLFSSVPKQPETQRGKNALFGEVGKAPAPFFPPSTKSQESPRSPSPVRLNSVSESLRPDNARSMSAPVPFKVLNQRQAQPARVAVPPKPQHSVGEIRKQERERLLAEQARKAAEERQQLVDDDDSQTRAILESDVTGSKTLDPFLAHQDYVGNIDKPGIPGQIEKVFRDINSMVDTLGLNARSLTAFVTGHQQQAKPSERTRDDLEDIDDWCLAEVEDLNAIEMDLSEQLDNNKLQDVPRKVATCRDLQKDLSHLRHKSHNLGRTIELRKDSSAAELTIQAPLNLDQQTQQHDLRKTFKHFQKQLAEAEERISLLRAKLAYAESQAGTNGRATLKQPTVEAVENTIRKMTAMVQKKRDDVDILEMQMRGLRFSSSTPPAGEIGNGDISTNRMPSPSFTRPYPSSASKKYRNSLRNGFQSSMTSHQESPLRRSLNGGDTASKASNNLGAEEVEELRAKARRRREVNGALRDVFGRGEVRIKGLEP